MVFSSLLLGVSIMSAYHSARRRSREHPHPSCLTYLSSRLSFRITSRLPTDLVASIMVKDFRRFLFPLVLKVGPRQVDGRHSRGWDRADLRRRGREVSGPRLGLLNRSLANVGHASREAFDGRRNSSGLDGGLAGTLRGDTAAAGRGRLEFIMGSF